LPRCCLSIIVVNYKTESHLAECIRSLEPIRCSLPCQLIVVDSSASECRLPLPESVSRGVEIVESPNRGYGAACNLGLQRAQGSYLLFLNADARYSGGSVVEFLNWLDASPDVALVGPRVLNLDGTRQLSCRSFPSWSTALCHRYSLLSRLAPDNALSRSYLRSDLDGLPAEVDWASGCCLFARAQALRQVSGFDEGYFLYFEDVDLAYRLNQRGWKCMYYPGISFTHSIGASRALLPDQAAKAKYASAARYFSKNVVRRTAFTGAISALAALGGQLSAVANRARTALVRLSSRVTSR